MQSSRTFILAAVMLLLSVTQSLAADQPEQLLRARTQGSHRYYSGTVTLTGTAERRTDSETLEIVGDEVCFFPTGNSIKIIPREKPDDRSPWFCFSDRKAAQALLHFPAQKPKGSCGYTASATVVVTDYVVDLKESEVFDIARLVRVVSSRPAERIPCTQ